MKTLLFTLEYPPFKGGIANYYKNLVKHWPKPDDIFVLHNNDNKLINHKLPFLKWLPALIALRQEIKKNNIDYVLVGNILPLGTATWLLSFFCKFKYAVIIHGTDIAYAQKSSRKKRLAKKILSRANTIVCNSSYGASLVKEINSNWAKKIVIANPCVEEFQGEIKLPKKNITEGKNILFSISRLMNRKGIDRVIEIMPEITAKFPNMIYVIAGTGPDEESLKKQAKDQDNIMFLGKISEAEKWGWLKNCDIFIQPTREEDGNFDGFGIVYLEANLMEKPVIAGDSGGVRDAVENGLNGLLVDPENNEDIKNAIIKLTKDKNLAKKLGEQSRERVKTKFIWSEQIKNIYNKINK